MTPGTDVDGGDTQTNLTWEVTNCNHDLAHHVQDGLIFPQWLDARWRPTNGVTAQTVTADGTFDLAGVRIPGGRAYWPTMRSFRARYNRMA